MGREKKPGCFSSKLESLYNCYLASCLGKWFFWTGCWFSVQHGAVPTPFFARRTEYNSHTSSNRERSVYFCNYCYTICWNGIEIEHFFVFFLIFSNVGCAKGVEFHWVSKSRAFPQRTEDTLPYPVYKLSAFLFSGSGTMKDLWKITKLRDCLIFKKKSNIMWIQSTFI